MAGKININTGINTGISKVSNKTIEFRNLVFIFFIKELVCKSLLESIKNY